MRRIHDSETLKLKNDSNLVLDFLSAFPAFDLL